jgi:hypothetical protein
MEASAAATEDLHGKAASAAGGEVVEVHEYDLVYAHLHVPQMT